MTEHGRVSALLVGRTITKVEVDDDDGRRDITDITLHLDNGARVEISSWGAYGEDSGITIEPKYPTLERVDPQLPNDNPEVSA